VQQNLPLCVLCDRTDLTTFAVDRNCIRLVTYFFVCSEINFMRLLTHVGPHVCQHASLPRRSTNCPHVGSNGKGGRRVSVSSSTKFGKSWYRHVCVRGGRATVGKTVRDLFCSNTCVRSFNELHCK
jgi:hypothetical protein